MNSTRWERKLKKMGRNCRPYVKWKPLLHVCLSKWLAAIMSSSSPPSGQMTHENEEINNNKKNKTMIYKLDDLKQQLWNGNELSLSLQPSRQVSEAYSLNFI